MANLTPEKIKAGLAAKLGGADVLDRITAEHDLDLFVMYSSINGVYGYIGQLFADVAPDFVDHIVDFGFGEIYARPGLQPAERQIAAVAALTVIGNQWSLRNHIEIGLRAGMSPQQIVAVIMQTIPYAGFPKAAEALLLARQIFDEHTIPSLAEEPS